LQQRVAGWMWRSFFVFLAAYVVVSTMAVLWIPHSMANFERWPAAWIVVVLNVLAVANIPRAIHHGRAGWAFVSSCCSIAALTFLVAMALYPDLAISSVDPAWSIDIYGGASSEGTLGIMLIVALIGMPLVATYTAIVYWVFRGKVRLDDHSY
jgi:cytochrome d ubiquinol oxidase subunit II